MAAAFPEPDLRIRLPRRLVHNVCEGVGRYCSRGCESGYAVEGGCKWRGGAVGKFPVVLGWVCYMAGSAMISGLAGLPLSFVRSYRGKGRGADL